MTTMGSVFSGVGGLELGLERAGIARTIWQCEINAFCRAVLERHWPGIRRFEDVTAVRDWPYVDVLCGGSPCQNLSSAGDRSGLAGPKSSLFFRFRDVVKAVRPRLVVFENVASGARQWLSAVRGSLCELGYRTRALEVRAADVGLPHLRARVFVVAYAHREGEPQQEWPLVEERGRARDCGEEANRWSVAAEPAVARMADGIPRRLDRASGLANAVAPPCAEVVGRMIPGLVWEMSRRTSPSNTASQGDKTTP